jgi:hypothetical protein
MCQRSLAEFIRKKKKISKVEERTFEITESEKQRKNGIKIMRA